jgi:hypothetical protein
LWQWSGFTVGERRLREARDIFQNFPQFGNGAQGFLERDQIAGVAAADAEAGE